MAATKIKKRQIENLQIVDADIAAAAAIAISKIAGLNDALDSKEPAFTKNTAFNKKFGTASGTVAEGDHTHSFSQLTDIPTTLAGFGITDAYTKSESDAITGDLGNLETTDKSNLVAALNELNGVVSDAVKPPLPIDCSGNPDYPAANKGDSYKVTKAGLIGGENGISVDVGDLMIASVDTPAGDHATVGANWGIYQANLDKATESVFGTGRIATTAEVTAGTNDQAWVTPAKLAAGFFSKTQLQTSGQAAVHWDNITNTPTTLSGYGITDGIYTNYTGAGWLANLAGGSGVDANTLPGANVFYAAGSGNPNFPTTGAFLSLRHPAGAGMQIQIRPAEDEAYFRGITNANEGTWYRFASREWVNSLPGLVPQTLSTSQGANNLAISGGNSVTLNNLYYKSTPNFPDDATSQSSGFHPINISNGTGWPSPFGFALLASRPSGENNNNGSFVLFKSSTNDHKIRYSTGAGETWNTFSTFASEEYVAENYLPLTGGSLTGHLKINAESAGNSANGINLLSDGYQNGVNSLLNIGTQRGSGAVIIGQGVKVADGAVGFLSSHTNNATRTYLKIGNSAANTGGLWVGIAPQQNTAVGQPVTGLNEYEVWHSGNLTPVDAAKYVAKEALAGAKDGSNKTFTLANTPIAGKEMIFLNGQLLQSGSGADYTISGTTVTLTDNQAAPVADDVILGTYIY